MSMLRYVPNTPQTEVYDRVREVKVMNSREQNPKNVVAGTRCSQLTENYPAVQVVQSRFQNQKIKAKVLGLFFCVSPDLTLSSISLSPKNMCDC